MTEALDAGRRSYEQRAWQEAFAQLSAEDGCAPLGLDDLERLAVAAHLAGHDAESVAVWGRAHRAALDGGDACRAARCAFWLSFGLLLRGEMAPAAGWLTRAQRALDGAGVGDCAERGLLLLPAAVGHLHGGDPDAALIAFTEALSFGERFGGVDLVALGHLGRGQALVLGDRRAEGFAELDELMAVVLAGEVSPMIAGLGVLRGDRDVPPDPRSPPGTGVDRGAQPLVPGPAAAGVVPGPSAWCTGPRSCS